MFVFICMPFLFLTSIVYAQQESNLDEDDFFGETPIVISISRLSQPINEAPSSATVITQQMIQQAGITDLPDIFRLVPGFNVTHSSHDLNGFNSNVTYHGMNSLFNRQLQVLIDGRAVFIPSFGGVPWNHLPLNLEDIERIEVTRGPNAASYGANSYLAIINIITKDPSQEAGAKIITTHSLNDSLQQKDIYLNYTQQVDDLNWKISYKNLSNNGFDKNGISLNQDSNSSQVLNIRTDFLTSATDYWSAQIGINQGEFDIGSENPYSEFLGEDIENYFTNIKYETNSDHASTSIRFSDTHHRTTNQTLISIGDLNFNKESNRTELELQQSRAPTDSLRLVYGASLREDTVESFYLFGDNDKHNAEIQRLFAHLEYALDHSQVIHFGSLIEKSNYLDTKMSPRLSYINHLNENHTLRLSSSIAYRNPVLYEAEGQLTFVLNPSPLLLVQSVVTDDIISEKNTSYEIGLNSQLSNEFRTDAKIFVYTLSNQIIETKTTALNVLGDEIKTFINFGKTKVTGFEIGTQYSPRQNISIHTNLSLIDASSNVVEMENSFPDVIGSSLAHFMLEDQQSITAAVYYISKMHSVDFASSANVPAHTKVDLRYQKKFKNNFSIELIGKNLASKYFEYFKDDSVSASYFLRMRGAF